MKNILITGGPGLVGTELSQLLKAKGYEVGILTRKEKGIAFKEFVWNPVKNELDQEAIEWADGIIHLAGAGVADKYWTEKRKQELIDSRIDSTQLLRNAIEKASNKPSAFVSASAIGYYGFKTSNHYYTENDAAGDGFLADLTVAWEKEIQSVATTGVRTSFVRIGIVLSNKGGALDSLTKPPVYAVLGSGDQWMAWIHIKDLCGIFIHLLENEHLQGAFNGVAPKPHKLKGFTKKLKFYKNKITMPIHVPGFLLKIGVGEMADMLLESSPISSKKIEEAGFSFEFPGLEEALVDLKKD